MAGLYSSLLAKKAAPLLPPVTKTDPLANTAGVCRSRAMLMDAADVQTPVAGWYNSVLAKEALPLDPPVISTDPLTNTDEVWYCRAVFMLPVLIHAK